MLKIKIAPRSLQNGDTTITIMVLFHYRFAGFFFDANEIALGGLCLRFQAPEKENEMETKNIGERLRLLRTRSNMSQEELARKLHLGSRSAVSELEMEKRTLSPTMIREYAELFDVSADWIIFGQDDKERMERKIETDEILKAFFSIRKAAVRKVAIEQIRALAKL